MGSIPEARRAGRYTATAATIVSTNNIPRKARGSLGVTSNSSPSSPRARVHDATSPTPSSVDRRRHRTARLITIDVDVTANPTHGAQQLTFFNGLCDTSCYLPLVATLTFDGESRQYPVAAVSR